jgi:CubicO group peptidase (beta-lactamase class C family)
MRFFSLLLFVFSFSDLLGQRGSQVPRAGSEGERLNKINAVMPVVEKLYADYAKENHLPGLAFGLVVDGQLLYSGALGMADLKTSTAVTPKSMFRIASMSKSITAMGILSLRKEGKLKLDDPAYLYIPELRNMPPITADAPAITIRHLLTHAAGFPEDNPWGDRQLGTNDQQLIDLIKKGISFSNTPGIGYEYSNLGFAMLGKIISNVSGMPYQKYINETIFKALGMHHTIWEYTEAPAAFLAHGYRYEDGIWKEEAMEHDGTYGAMGGLITSVDDFSKYVAFHMSAWPASSRAETGPVLRSDVREMQQPWNFNNLNPEFKYPSGRKCAVVSAYGYGLRWSKDCEGRLSVGHSGGLPGFGSQWQILPDYGIGIVAYANRTYAGMATMNTTVLDTIIALTGLKARGVVVSDILNQRKTELLGLLPSWKGATSSGIFAENFFPDKSLAHRKKESDDIFAQIGAVERVSEFFAENQLRGYFTMHGAKGQVRIFFTLSPESEALIQKLDVSLIR